MMKQCGGWWYFEVRNAVLRLTAATAHQPSICTTDLPSALAQAFTSCRLDYCNSVLAGVPDVYLQRLQSVQNVAARLVSGARRHNHITPVLVS